MLDRHIFILKRNNAVLLSFVNIKRKCQKPQKFSISFFLLDLLVLEYPEHDSITFGKYLLVCDTSFLAELV